MQVWKDTVARRDLDLDAESRSFSWLRLVPFCALFAQSGAPLKKRALAIRPVTQ